MQFTKSTLKQIIKEELALALTEAKSINIVQVAFEELKKTPNDKFAMKIIAVIPLNQ